MRETAGYLLIILILALLGAGGAYFWYNSAGQKFRRHAARTKAKRSKVNPDLDS